MSEQADRLFDCTLRFEDWISPITRVSIVGWDDAEADPWRGILPTARRVGGPVCSARRSDAPAPARLEVYRALAEARYDSKAMTRPARAGWAKGPMPEIQARRGHRKGCTRNDVKGSSSARNYARGRCRRESVVRSRNGCDAQQFRGSSPGCAAASGGTASVAEFPPSAVWSRRPAWAPCRRRVVAVLCPFAGRLFGFECVATYPRLAATLRLWGRACGFERAASETGFGLRCSSVSVWCLGRDGGLPAFLPRAIGVLPGVAFPCARCPLMPVSCPSTPAVPGGLALPRPGMRGGRDRREQWFA